MKEIVRTHTKTSQYEDSESKLLQLMQNSSIPDNEMLDNLHLFITPQQFRRIYFLTEVYKQILEVPGCVMQFGVRWGRELALFESLRTLFESFHHARRIVGFDTFDGYAGVDRKDGGHAVMAEGNLSTTNDYESELQRVLSCRNQLDPLGQIVKFDLVAGDVAETLPAYLEENPHTVVALAHLDLNLYAPTKTVLELLLPHIPKGGVIIIDEVALKSMPGETIALKEIFGGLSNLRLRRIYPGNTTWQGYFVVE